MFIYFNQLRPNLFISVSLKSGSIISDFMKFMKDKDSDKKFKFSGSTIIYVGKRDDTTKVADELKRIGLKAGTYHAGMNLDARKKVQTDFINDQIDVRKLL